MRWQYQQKVEPLFTTALEWQVPTNQPPDRKFAAAPFITSVWVPQHADAEGSDLGWTPRYPDAIARFTVRAVDQPFFTTTVLPVPELSWQPVYPDWIARLVVRAADQPFFTTGSTHSSLPVPDLSWGAVYPDWIARQVVRAADQPFFVTGRADEAPPAPESSWTPQYPDYVWRVTLPSGAMPTLFEEPFPRAGSTLLSAWAIYPDSINRIAVHPSRLPYHVPGPLEPIPNPPIVGVIDDKFHLGSKESLGVTNQPTLGGWQAW